MRAMAIAALAGAWVLCAADSGDFFRSSDVSGEFRVVTPLLEGTIRPAGASLGLTPLVHRPTGRRLASELGLLTHYRVFAGDHRFGSGMRDFPSEASVTPEGTLRVVWPENTERPFELSAEYTWRGPATLDLVTRVRPSVPLADFEVFLSSYLNAHFPVTAVYARPAPDAPPAFITAERDAGDWQMYARDSAAEAQVRDGRWAIGPSPVDWTFPARMAAPLLVRRDADTGVAVVLMAPAEECFAVSTPYRGENHWSMYLSLFGRNLAAGEIAVARARLIVTSDVTDGDILELYAAYLADLEKE
jgi:hypothetical protein